MHLYAMLYFKTKVCREPGSQGVEILICMSHSSMSLVCSRGAGQAAFQLQSLWSTDMIDPKPCQSSLEYPRVSIRQRTGRHQSIACPWWQCQKLEAKIGSLKAIRQRLQSDEMNDTSWYFQFTRCFQQSNGAKVDIEMSRSPSSIERYRTYQYSYNDNQWQMTANSWRWHVNTLQAKPSHEIKLAAQQWIWVPGASDNFGNRQLSNLLSLGWRSYRFWILEFADFCHHDQKMIGWNS